MYKNRFYVAIISVKYYTRRDDTPCIQSVISTLKQYSTKFKTILYDCELPTEKYLGIA